jgi:hypothetical protein
MASPKTKSTSFIGWRTFLTLPGRGNEYGSLVIEAMPMRPSDGTAASRTSPVPLFYTDSSAGYDEVLAFKFQSNADKPTYWYGGRMEWRCRDLTHSSRLMTWLARFPQDLRYAYPADLIGMLETRARRIAYSCTLGHYVEAKHWFDAEMHRTYYDVGAKSNGGGCLINTYALANAFHEDITAAVAKALRESAYCTDDQFADWIANGKRWSASSSCEGPQHRPHAYSEILGPEAVGDEPEAAAA